MKRHQESGHFLENSILRLLTFLFSSFDVNMSAEQKEAIRKQLQSFLEFANVNINHRNLMY